MSEIHAEVHEVNRLDFYCALRAVLEHVGTAVKQLDAVSMADGALWATDALTAGYASVDASLPAATLPSSEARELARFVKPNRVAEREGSVLLAVQGDFLHVGLRQPGMPETDSEVYDVRAPNSHKAISVWTLVQHISKLPRLSVEGAPAAAGLLARFKSAERHPSDRMRVYPKLSSTGPRAVVTVGDKFVGLIAGLSAPAPGVEVADATLEDWGL